MNTTQIGNEFTRPFEQSEYDNWKDTINNYEINNIQQMKKIQIGSVNLSQYVNDGAYHSDNHGDYAHSDTAGSHNQTGTSYSKSWYEQGYQHRNSSGTQHVDQVLGYYTTTDTSGNIVEIPSHSNYSTGGGYYADFAHADELHPNDHTQTGYSQSTPHSNTQGEDYGYSQYVPHSDYVLYNQQHVNIENYIPTAPKFYEIEDSGIKRLFGKSDIRLYSYDANKFGFGSNLEITKKIEYKLEIRKVQNLDGTPSTSGWVTLRDFDMAEVYTLNTIDPLRTGNSNPKTSNGIYEIKATPRNPRLVVSGQPSAYYDFVGDSKTTTVKIEQNNSPDIVVTNPNEFIKFTFGPSKVKTVSNSLKDYTELLYANAPKDKFKGVFVSMDVTDLDLENYIKGCAKIYDQSNNLIATEDIIFSNGKQVIKTMGQKQSGYVFFPIDKLLRQKHDINNVVEITIKDYLDESCAIETKTVTVQRNISKINSTILNLNVDNLQPTITTNPSTTQWTNQDVMINVSATDNSGIEKIIDNDNKEFFSSSIKYAATQIGTYTFKAIDSVGNLSTKSININNIDKEPPQIDCDLSQLGKGKIQVTDNLSGVKTISYRLTNSDVKPTSGFTNVANNGVISASITTPYLHVQAWDNANNYIIKTFRIRHLDVSGVITPNPAKQGQRIMFNIKTIGYANVLSISFPKEFTDLDFENTKIYDSVSIREQMDNTENIYYFVPLEAPLTLDKDGNRIRPNYRFVVTARNKDGVEVKTNLYLDVKDNILDDLRTRIR